MVLAVGSTGSDLLASIRTEAKEDFAKAEAPLDLPDYIVILAFVSAHMDAASRTSMNLGTVLHVARCASTVTSAKWDYDTKVPNGKVLAHDPDNVLTKRLLAEIKAYALYLDKCESEGIDLAFVTLRQESDTFAKTILDARVVAVMEPLVAKLAEYQPIAQGSPDGASWHSTLTDAATVPDCADLGQQAGQLLSLANYREVADEIQKMFGLAKEVWTLFDIPKDNNLKKQVVDVCQKLLVTSAEQTLLTLFTVAVERYSDEVRESKVRAIRSTVGGPSKFGMVFKPLRDKALEVLKGKH